MIRILVTYFMMLKLSTILISSYVLKSSNYIKSRYVDSYTYKRLITAFLQIKTHSSKENIGSRAHAHQKRTAKKIGIDNNCLQNNY